MKERQRKRTIQGRRFARTFVSTALALLLAGSGLEIAPMAKAANTASLQNPRISEVQGGGQDEASALRNPRVKMRIRDTITFGSYWQEDTNGDGMADQNDAKQPIRWQVLSVDGDDVFLLADKVLDCQPYNTENTSVTWETCSLRRWLNEEFYNTAFSDTEKAAIKETTVINVDNPEYSTEGGADTKDKVFLLSLSEVSDPAYGFHGEMGYDDQARIGKATSYTEAEDNDWWLRSPGGDDSDAADVVGDGYADPYGNRVSNSNDGVRPALNLNLSSYSPNEAGIVETAMEESEWDMVELGIWQRQPLYWRVISVKDGDAYLLADRVLADKAYHETYESVIWEKSTLREWLNGDFYQTAFSGEEKAGIRNVMWEDPDNPWYDTEGGADTTDSVALLSLADIVKKEYGFPTAYQCNSDMRAAVDGKKVSSIWWLRSPDYYGDHAACVVRDIYVSLNGRDVNSSSLGVRPALHFNLSSSSLTKVGTVTAKEDYLTGGTSSGVTYDPPSLYGESDPEPEQPSKPSDPSGGSSTGSDQPSSSSTPFGGSSTGGLSGGSSSGTPSNSQGQTGNGGISGGSVTQGQGSTGSQNGTQAGEEDTKLGKVTSLKAKNNKKKTVTLSWKKVRGAKNYQIQYSQNKKFKKAKTKTVKKVKCTITKLAKSKTWYFRVRAISSGGKKGTWSKAVKVKVKK